MTEPNLVPIRHNKLTRAQMGLPNYSSKPGRELPIRSGSAGASQIQKVGSAARMSANPATDVETRTGVLSREKVETALALAAFVAMSVIYALGK